MRTSFIFATVLGLLLASGACADSGPTDPEPDQVITPEYGVLAVGSFHSCLIEPGGGTVCWGLNLHGTVGDGTTNPGGQPKPRTPVAGSPTFTSISTNGQYTCGRTLGGADLCWGRNPALGPAGATQVPTALSHGPYLQISPARLTACAITPSNGAVCWGLNQAGELGNPTLTPSLTPVPVQTTLLFKSIDASWMHSCALTVGGGTYCWGRSADGTNNPSPVPVPGGHAFSRLFTGGSHTCGITARGDAWCWGSNSGGQLGSGTAGVGGGTPIRVAGGHKFAMLATGKLPVQTSSQAGSHTCGITTLGQVLCWGANSAGQIGDGTTTDRLTPTPILSAEVFVAIGAGDNSTCAMTVDRRVFCWGSNAEGELGLGTFGGFSAVPVRVP